MKMGMGAIMTSSSTTAAAIIAADSGYVATASWDFDGTDDYINMSNSSTIKITAADTSEAVGITVSAWVKNDTWGGVTAYNTIVSCYEFATGGKGWFTQFYGNAVKWNLDTAAGTKSLNTGWRAFAVADGSSGDPARAHWRESGWHHVTMTYDGKYLRTYVDGGVANGTNVHDFGSDDNNMQYGINSGDVDLMIGADPGTLSSPDGGTTWTPGTSSAGSYWNGLINEVAIWDKALDAAAISDIFDAVDVDGAVLDLTKDSGDYDYSGDLIGLWRPSDGIDGTTATNIANPGTHDGVIKNSLGTSSEVPS